MTRLQKLTALLATAPFIASSNAALADQFFETVSDNSGNSYCIGTTTGVFTYKDKDAGIPDSIWHWQATALNPGGTATNTPSQ